MVYADIELVFRRLAQLRAQARVEPKSDKFARYQLEKLALWRKVDASAAAHFKLLSLEGLLEEVNGLYVSNEGEDRITQRAKGTYAQMLWQEIEKRR